MCVKARESERQSDRERENERERARVKLNEVNGERFSKVLTDLPFRST